ncbi:MAG: bifunctional [glutamate--ammonia ligase]-adenylyl-L-tyrosine phosphorylase/[glutamate--ammonia-ligase] adenylyltransferase, partial [Myxococcota bacterium]
MEVFRYSRFVEESCARDSVLRASVEAGEFERPQAPGVMRAAADALLAGEADETRFMDALRAMRRREFVRIAWRDLTGRAPLAEVLADLSEFADAAISIALAFAARALESRHGVARSPDGERQELVVIGMGKLGGRELNFSSDVDLVFL